MTDQATFPFDAMAEPDDPATGMDRRRLLLFLSVGVIASAVIGYFLVVALFSGDDQIAAPTASTLTTSAPPASSTPSASLAPAPQSSPGPVNRNPFIPLVFPPAAGTGAGAPAAGATAAPGSAVPPQSAPTTPGMVTFKVLSVAGTRAVVNVDGVRYAASVGRTFAKTYKLVATAGGACGDFLSGGSRFVLCEGQTLIF